MASIRKRGKKWLAEVRLKEGYCAKSFETRLQAQVWAIEQEQRLSRDCKLVQGKTLADAFQRYARDVSPSKKGQRWEVARLTKLARVNMAMILLTDLRTDDLERWKNHELKRLKPSSVNRELNLIASVLEIARKRWKWIETNPVRDLDRPRNPRPRERRISDDEVMCILDAFGYGEDSPIACSYQEVAVGFLLALETAMRQGELWKLDWQCVHLSDRFVTLLNTKNGSNRDVPLSLRAITLFMKLSPKIQGRVFHTNQQSAAAAFRRVVKSTGIKGLTFHDTRHEALTRLARKLDVLDLARMVGHHDPRSLMIYYNPTASEIAQRLDSN